MFKLCWTLAHFSFNSYWCFSISRFTSLVGVSVDVTSFKVRVKICAVTAGIKMYKLIVKKKYKKTWQNIGARKR